MSANPENLTSLLTLTLHPDRQQRRQASDELDSMQTQSGFCLTLLQVIDMATGQAQNSAAAVVQQSAAVFFKNHIKKYWEVDGTAYSIPENDKALVRQNIVDLMCKVPKTVMSQLSESVRIIGDQDFPDRWQNLLPDIKQKLGSTSDANVINGLLETLNTLFKMFRGKQASDALWLKLKYTLENIQEDILRFFTSVITDLKNTIGKNSIEMLTSMRLLCRIFFSLNWQTIPEFFEDNMAFFMESFHFLLTQNNYTDTNFISSDSRDKTISVQSAVICNLSLYAEKYDEEFGNFLEQFTQDTWTLLVNCTLEEEFDDLVSTALGFLSTLILKTMNIKVFDGQGVLESISEKVILPNLMLRENDVEKFEDNALDYVRGDLEGGDKASRRSSAVALVRSATKNFEAKISSICLQVLQNNISTQLKGASLADALANLNQSSDEEATEKAMKSIEVGIALFIAVAAKKYTFGNGVSELNGSVGFDEFFSNIIIPILSFPVDQITNANFALLSSAALKFLVVFRRQIEPRNFSEIIQVLVRHMQSKFFVVYTYAGICVERLLSIRDNSVSKYGFKDLQTHSGELLQSLFGIVERNILEQREYNEYAMRTILKIMVVMEDNLIAHESIFLSKLMQILLKVCENPQNPVFNHYVFESLAVIIKVKLSSNTGGNFDFESELFPLFQQILQQDISELSSYVFQIMALLLELNKSTQPNIVTGYLSVFPALLTPTLWQNKGNSLVLVRLLKAFLSKTELRNQIVQNPKNLEGLMGIFQKLFSANSTEVYGFKLLIGIVQFVDPTFYSNFLSTVFQIIFTKFQSKKTSNQSKQQFCVFLAVLVSKISTTKTIQAVNSVAPDTNLFQQVMEFFYLSSVKSFTDRAIDKPDRKASLVGLIYLLTETPDLVTQNGVALGAKILITILEALSNMNTTGRKQTPAIDFGDQLLAGLEETGYSSNHSNLSYATGQNFAPFKEIGSSDKDIGVLLAQRLVAQRANGVDMMGFVQNALGSSPEQAQLRQVIGDCMQAAGVSL